VKIPDDVDILITHGPPSGILDMTSSGQHAGCSQLVDEVMNRVRPRVHIFGHIHETYGIEKRDEIVFVNASTCTYNYKPTNPPVEFIIPIIVSTGDTEEAVKAPKVTILNQGEKSKGCTTH
jgi:predicted phosphodiesterase